MLSKALEFCQQSVFLGGNIGNAYSNICFEEKKIDYAVIELSSFQLERIIDFRPLVACIVNCIPHHLERYSDPDDYALAKLNIFKNYDEAMPAFIGDPFEFKHLLNLKDKKFILFNHDDFKQWCDKYDWQNCSLIGIHNKKNFYTVFEILKTLKFDLSFFQDFINQFQPPLHRLELVKSKNEILIINDSKSTNLSATMTALKALPTKPTSLILGGKLRGGEVNFFHDLITQFTFVKRFYFFGESRLILSSFFNEIKPDTSIECFVFDDLESVMNHFYLNQENHQLLFSPGFPSQDQFKNFEQRGSVFKDLVAKNAL